ncbi:MAG: FG-GAP repeat domain-containing protein [Limisphaerales bacterium]
MAFDISTTATFVGPITVCFKVPSVTDPVAFSKLRVLHTVPKLDVAGANPNNNNTPIFLGNGAGGFGTATSFAVGSYPQSVAKGDFNGDGKLDLAVANSSSNNVSVLSGNGSGGFGAATNFAVGNYPISVVTGDFNRDGKPDVAVANYAGNNVSVLLANAAGGFAAPTNFAVGTNPRSVVIGDFNGDGKLDLAVANTNSNNVSILLGTGNGGFSSATVFPVGQSPFSVVVGDFNGDGKLDLAVANYASHNVSILFGNGAGSFAPASNVGLGNNQSPLSMAVGDFNGDGKLDLVTANALFGNVEVLLGNGNGAFGPPTFFQMIATLTSLVTADFNNDGKLDLATGTASDGIAVRLGLGNGGFGAVTKYSGGTLYGLAVGNFNGDVAVVDQTILSGPDAPNFATRTICARVLSFSPIVIASADDQTSPVISNVSADPSVIWPPNHDMIDVTINYDVSDDFTAAAEIVSSLDVFSNEPVNTTGDGNTESDIEIVDAHHVRVRAERSGNGSGRVYTITITCKDSAQNTSQTMVTVVVPKSQH